MINFKQFITEARMAPLYHGTTLDNVILILSSNKLKALESDADTKAVSFTRSKKYAVKWAKEKVEQYYDIVVLELDQNKLAQRYKITPHNYFGQRGMPKPKARYLKDDPNFGANESEERVFKDITPVLPYITKILVVDTSLINASTLKNYTRKTNIKIEAI